MKNGFFSTVPLAAVILLASSPTTAGEPSGHPGDPEKGREIAEKHCSRCHVIPGRNPLGGIGSTLSFASLVKLPDYRERLATFFDRRPHPPFVRIQGIERWTAFPPNAAEIKLTLEDVDHVVAYGERLRNQGQ